MSAPRTPTSIEHGHRDDSERRRVMFIHGKRNVDHAIIRVLRATESEVDLQVSLHPLPRPDLYDLVIVDYDELPLTERTLLVETYKDSGAASKLVLVLSGSRVRSDMGVIFDSQSTVNVTARNRGIDSDFFVTLQKILKGDIFGIEKYFSWGVRGRHRRVVSSSERDDVLRQASQFMEHRGINERFIELAATIIDELVTNALYNAPVDTLGRSLYGHLHRSTPVSLDPSQAATVKLIFDGVRLGISVVDSFGSLAERSVLNSLSQGYRREPDQISSKPGGAGLGFYYVLESSSQMVVNIGPRDRTEVISLIDVRHSFREYASEAKSFNCFIARPTIPVMHRR